MTSSCETQKGLCLSEDGGLWETKVYLLRVPSTYSLAHILTHSQMHLIWALVWGQLIEESRDI